MKAGILSELLAIWMTSTMFATLAVNVGADDRYINNQTQIALTPSNYPGGVPSDWYYPGDAITGTLIGQPTGGMPPPADGLEDTLDVVTAADDGVGGCDAFILADIMLQANNILLDPSSGAGTFIFPGTSTLFLSDGYYCAWVAPGDYIEGVSPTAYRGVHFQIHESRIQASTDRGGYVPGNMVGIFYTISDVKFGSPMTMTGYQADWLVQSSDHLTYALGNLVSSAGQFNFTISNTGGVNPIVMYPAAIWFNSTGGGATRRAAWSQSFRVGTLTCNILSPTSGATYMPGAVMEVDVVVDASTPTNYDYPGAVVLIKILDGGTLASPEILAYTRTFVSDGAGYVSYAFVLDPAVFLDGKLYTVSAQATSVLMLASDWTLFNVRTRLDTMSVRLTLDKTSYYSDESAIMTVLAQPPQGHSPPSTYLYSVTTSGGGQFARVLSGNPTLTFHIPSDYQGALTFRADVNNVEGDYGWDVEQRAVDFGFLIVNVNPGQYHANDQLTVSFELESLVMTGPTTSFYYTAWDDASRIVKEEYVDTGSALQGSFLFVVPNAPSTRYVFEVLASGNGHVLSSSVEAILIRDFILSISLDKASYLPGENMAVAYSIVPMDPATPLPRVYQFGYEVIGLPFIYWQTLEATGLFHYPIPQDADEGNAIFEVQEVSTGAIALKIFLIGSPVGPTVPSSPQNLQTTSGNAQVKLTWTAPASNGGQAIIAYRIYRGNASGGETLLLEVGNVLTYADSGVTNGQTYYYVLTARNGVGEGANSTEVTATPMTVPSQALNLQTTAGHHLVTLAWAAPTSDGGSAITGYKIYRGTSGGSETFLAIVGNTSSYTDAGLTAGQAYYYKVAAVNAAGEGAMSSEANATPSAPPSDGGAAGTPANELMSFVLLVLAIIFLVIAAALMVVNLRRMRQHSEGKQTAEMRKPDGQRK